MPSRRTLPQQPSRTATRGITSADVDRAADSLLRDGERPTIEKVRLTIGRGSPNTINPLLDQWWSRLASRLDAGPAALHRLPEPVLLAAEGLWMQTLDEARKRAAAEQGSRTSALARDRQDLEVRSHVLSIRESEFASQLQDRDRRIAQLELELQTLVTVLRKEQASRAAAERRLAAVAPAPAGRTQRRPPRPGVPRAKSHKQVKKSPRASAAKRRTLAAKKTRRR